LVEERKVEAEKKIKHLVNQKEIIPNKKNMSGRRTPFSCSSSRTLLMVCFLGLAASTSQMAAAISFGDRWDTTWPTLTRPTIDEWRTSTKLPSQVNKTSTMNQEMYQRQVEALNESTESSRVSARSGLAEKVETQGIPRERAMPCFS
jgi:hypothetical protein